MIQVRIAKKDGRIIEINEPIDLQNAAGTVDRIKKNIAAYAGNVHDIAWSRVNIIREPFEVTKTDKDIKKAIGDYLGSKKEEWRWVSR